MRPVSILLAENDSRVVGALVTTLDRHAHSVKVVHSLRELRTEIVHMSASALIVDLEVIDLAEVAILRREFKVPIICTHRVPDDELWTAVMAAGADDICENDNAGAVLRALRDKLSGAPVDTA